MRAPDFWYPRDGGDPVVSKALAPLGWLYGAGGWLKQKLATPVDPGIPVICIGNVTAGGTGKTPLARDLLRRLAAHGHRPYLVTRGYGGREAGPLAVDRNHHRAEDVGDEPLMLAGDAPVIVARRRAEGARLAVGNGATAIVLDDGFQNPSLLKYLNLLVIDSETLFGNGRMIPAGPLREPVRAGSSRADAIVLMGARSAAADTFAASLDKPVFRARLIPDAQAVETLRQRHYLAFAGIGRPEKFFATARNAGLILVGTRSFPDHHPYTSEDMGPLIAEAGQRGVGLLTTEKDAMRLDPDIRSRIDILPVTAAFEDETGYNNFWAERIAGVHTTKGADGL